MKKYLDKVFYRAAGAALTALPTVTGTYPAITVAGWTEIAGGKIETSKLGLEPEKSMMADGTEATEGEKGTVEISVKDFTPAQYATLRSALINTKVDVLAIDNDVRTVGYAVQGVILYPAVDITGAESPKLVISGERNAGTSASNTPFKPLAAA